MVWQVSRWPEKFPDGLESLQMAWKFCRLPGKFPDGLESFQKRTSVFKDFPGLLPCVLVFFPPLPSLSAKLLQEKLYLFPFLKKFCHEISSSSRRLPCDQHCRLPPVFVARPSLPGRVCSASSATSSLWWICWNLLLSWHGHSRAIFMGDNSAQATNENNNQCKPFNSSAPIYYSIAFCGNGDAFMKLAW